jgi:hypothetical protein
MSNSEQVFVVTVVIPANTGIQATAEPLDTRFRGVDERSFSLKTATGIRWLIPAGYCAILAKLE